MMTLVLLPGLDGTSLLFERLIAALGGSMETLAIVYPSDKVLDYAQLVQFVGERLPQDRPYFLLAESFSGPIAICLAASLPKGLQGLILSCSFACNPFPRLSICRSLIGVVPIPWLPPAVLCYFALARFSSLPLRRALVGVLQQVAVKVLQARLQAVLSVDVSQQLAAIEVPVFYLRATEDRLVSEAASRHIVAVKPATCLIDIVGPHFLLQVRAKQAAEVIRGLLGLN